MINTKDKVYDIVTKYPKAKDYLISQGMEQLSNDMMLNTMAKRVSLDMVIKMKGFNRDLFLEGLEAAINDENIDATLETSDGLDKDKLTLTGVLPCPVRIPLLEKLQEFIDENSYADKLSYELKAASSGLDWLIEDVKKGEIADVFLSAGFDLFFDKKYVYSLKNKGMFKDLVDYKKYNEDFENEEMSLRDPKGEYSVLSVVPAVFLINTKELGDRKMPESWADLFSGDYDNQVSLPIGDFDLFNAILLNIYCKYGMDGVSSLGKCLLKSMHPSEMVKSDRGSVRPAVTIMPYFFTKMTGAGGPMKAVWPSDGAIISPIFMVTKKEKAEDVKPIADFFASKEIGEVLSHTGLFPSAHPDVDNHIPKENKYMWVGWDFIENNDVAEVLERCSKAFYEGSGGNK